MFGDDFVLFGNDFVLFADDFVGVAKTRSVLQRLSDIVHNNGKHWDFLKPM